MSTNDTNTIEEGLTPEQLRKKQELDGLLRKTEERLLNAIADSDEQLHGIEQYNRRREASMLEANRLLAAGAPRVGEADDAQFAAWRDEWRTVYTTITFDDEGAAHFAYFREINLEDYRKAAQCKDIDVEVFQAMAPGMFVGGSKAILESFPMQMEAARGFILDVFSPRGAVIKKN